MSESAPTSSWTELIEPFPADPEQDKETVRRNARVQRSEKWQQTKRLAARAVGVALLGSTIAAGQTYAYIQRDINIGKREVADSHPAVHEIYRTDNPEIQEVATYVATGMGTRDPSKTAEKLTAHQEAGNIYAVEYSNKEIDIYELTDKIVEHARANGIKYFAFDGYSAGGPIMLAVAAEIHERYDDLHVLSITLNSSPVGEGSLTEKSEEGAQIVAQVLQFWPDLAYSTKVHIAAEVLARNDRYYNPETNHIDIDSLKFEIEDVKRMKRENKERASGSLSASQIIFIYKYLTRKNIARLSEPSRDKQPPMIFATYGSNPLDDTVVRSLISAKNLQQIIDDYFMALDIVFIDNIGHANPSERPTEYEHAQRDHIIPFILSTLRIYHEVGGEPEYGDQVFITPPPAVESPRIGTSIPLQEPLR